MKSENLIGKVLASIFFKNSKSQASKIAGNPSAILSVVKKAYEKMSHLGPAGILSELRTKVSLAAKLIKAYATGEYRDVSFKNITIVLASILYFISPIDFIPDFIPLLGFADDIALLTFSLGSLGEELEKFELWHINDQLNNS